MTHVKLLAQMENFERCVLERDVQLAETVLDADYALIPTNPTLQIVPRAMWLGMLPDYVVHSWAVEDKMLHVTGDRAASAQRIDMQATVLGVDRSGLFIVTDIWQCDEGDWHIWRRHSTALSPAPMPGGS